MPHLSYHARHRVLCSEPRRMRSARGGEVGPSISHGREACESLFILGATVDFEEERLEAVVLLCGNGVEARAQARTFVKCRAGRVGVDRFHQQARIKTRVYTPFMVAPLLRRPWGQPDSASMHGQGCIVLPNAHRARAEVAHWHR